MAETVTGRELGASDERLVSGQTTTDLLVVEESERRFSGVLRLDEEKFVLLDLINDSLAPQESSANTYIKLLLILE